MIFDIAAQAKTVHIINTHDKGTSCGHWKAANLKEGIQTEGTDVLSWRLVL